MKLRGYKISYGHSDYLLEWSRQFADSCVAEYVLRNGPTFVLLKHLSGYRIFCFQHDHDHDTYQYSWLDGYRTLTEGLAGLAEIVNKATVEGID